MGYGGMENNHYVVATVKKWNIERFDEFVSRFPGRWTLIQKKEDLTARFLERLNPRYVFFPHWSWIVPESILSRWDCVCFHMTDVPFGRGGSPLQNLISRGFETTKLTALKMERELDAGAVYYKVDLGLGGSAQEIFERASYNCFEIIEKICKNEPEPKQQVGEIVHFSRRTPEQSELPRAGELKNIFDHIRMLDAESYPKAFIEYGEFRFELDQVCFNEQGELKASVSILKKTKGT